MKQVVIRQYQDIVDKAAKRLAGLTVPPEGWLRTVRRALGMSGAQLARRLGVSRAQVAQAEKNELAGSVTLKTLNKTAEAMGCRVVYAIVPDTTTGDLVDKRAWEKAGRLIRRTDTHMALEDQALDPRQRRFEHQRLARALAEKMPSDLWNDD